MKPVRERLRLVGGTLKIDSKPGAGTRIEAQLHAIVEHASHLDEEGRWGKLWNLVLGTNYRVGWLSAGQNIPGTFMAATAQDILSRQFAVK